jgi:hypothetical protein
VRIIKVLKKILQIILLLLATAEICLAEENLADPDLEPYDFRGIKWGQNLNTVEGMVEIYRGSDGKSAAYVRSEDLTFGEAKLDSIEYNFVEGKLATVSVTAKGEKNEKALLTEALNIYGPQTFNVGGDYMWVFSYINIMYSREEDFGQSALFYSVSNRHRPR